MREKLQTDCARHGASGSLVWIALAALVLAVFAVNGLWVTLDTRPPHWDAAAHLRIASKYLHVLTSPASRWVDLLDVESYYPPLYHLSLAPFLAWFGPYADRAVWVNGLYLSVIIVSTFGIGRTLFGWETGLAAAFFIACYPYLAYISRTCMIDTALTACVSLSYYCFIRSRNFEDTRFAFCFSVMLGLGMLVKWTFLFFLAPAVLIGLFSGGEASWRRAALRVRWANLLMVLGIPVLLCFPWYAHNLVKLVKSATKFSGAGTLEGDPTQGWDLWLYYFRIAETQTGLGLFLLFLVAGGFFLTCRRFFNPALSAWIVIPYVIFSLINNKDERYTLPLLPAVAVISARVIFLVERAAVRNVLLALTLAMGLLTWGLSGFSHHAWARWQLPVLGEVRPIDLWPPVREHWPIEQALKDMVAESGSGKGNPISVRTLTNHPSFHRGAFWEVVQAEDLPVELKIVKNNLGELTDFFITREGGKSFASSGAAGKINRLKNDPALTRTFPVFREYPLPDGSRGVVYGFKVRPATRLAGVNDLAEVAERLRLAFAKYPGYGISQGKNLRLTVLPTGNPDDLSLGRYRSITITADSAVIDKILFHDLRLALEEVQINLYELFLHDRLIFFKIGRLTPRLTLRFEDVEKRIAGKLRQPFRLDGEDNAVRARLELASPTGPLVVEARVRLDFRAGQSIRPIVDFIRVGPITVPRIFYRVFLNQELRLTPTPGWPLATDIRSVEILPRQLRINSATPTPAVRVTH
ncbi:MAG: LmeA family phospholipid-binding protein [Nitrospinales bacterium]